MLKSISFKKLAVLSAGLAIVLSSCGLQNDASDSSGAGKTKNFALLKNGSFCFDTPEERTQAIKDQIIGRMMGFQPGVAGGMPFIFDEVEFMVIERLIILAQIGGCVPGAPGIVAAAAQAAAEAGEVDPPVAAEAAIYACVKPEVKQTMIDGYTEQLAKTDYPADWSASVIADYKAQMQRGFEISELMCTN